MNLDRLTPAPWKKTTLVIHANAREPDGPDKCVQVVDSEHKDGEWNFLTVVARLDCTRGKYEYEEANAEFIVLARNAFDVETRRGWYSVPHTPGTWIAMNEYGKRLCRNDHTFFIATDSRTPLVDADAWYVANVEAAPLSR